MVKFDESYLIKDLQAKCKELGLSYGGRKIEIIKRLNDYYKNSSNDLNLVLEEEDEASEQHDEAPEQHDETVDEDDETVEEDDVLVPVPIAPMHENENDEDKDDDNEEEDDVVVSTKGKRKPVFYDHYKPTPDFNPVFENEADAKALMASLGYRFERPRMTKEGVKDFYKCKASYECKRKMYILYHDTDQKVSVWVDNNEHMHESTKKSIGINDITKKQIDILYKSSVNTASRIKIALTVLPNGYLASSAFQEIKIWNTNTGGVVNTLYETGYVYSLAVLNNGYLATGTFNKISIWITANGNIIRNITGQFSYVDSMTVLPNGYLVSGSYPAINIWNTETGSLIKNLTGHSSYIGSLVVLQNGYLASGSYDSTIKIWNTDTASLIRTLSGHTSTVISLAVLQNGYLASGSSDFLVKIWNTDSGSLLRTIRAHTSTVYSLAVLRNGFLASASYDGTIKLWNTNSTNFNFTSSSPSLSSASSQESMTSGLITSTSSYMTTSRYVLIDRFIKVNDLLPYGTSYGDSILTKADDSTFYISLNNNYNFYDTLYDYIYVCTNGYISIDSFLSTSISSYSNLSLPLVAGLAMDLDTRYSGNIYYRETNDLFILDSLKSYILEYNSSTDANSLFLNSAFIVTYDNVPFYSYSSTTNSFQIIITTSSNCETFAIVLYKF